MSRLVSHVRGQVQIIQVPLSSFTAAFERFALKSPAKIAGRSGESFANRFASSAPANRFNP